MIIANNSSKKLKITKSFIILIILIIVCTVSGCGNMKDTVQTNSENQLQAENVKLKSENELLKSKIDELENGAERRLNEIKDAFNNRNYDSAIELSQKLNETHPGSKEDKEAKKIVVQVNSIKIAEQKKAEIEAAEKIKEEQKNELQKAREIIRVKSIYPSEPNSADGVDLYIVWQNKSKKTIKYANFTVEPYNAVGDVVSCTIRDTSTFTGKETGPIKPNQWRDDSSYWECAWYNNTITKVKLTQIDIEYTDGTTVTLSGNDIGYVRY